ncbi:MAG TPA: S41 family peptidase [Gemmatimonadales bacterium]|nr:S41 family peptidase [Gemmatimonadales bacterium]
MAACTSLFIGPDTDFDRTGLLDHVWRDLDRHYSLFVVKTADWDSLHDVYIPLGAQAPTDSALADVVGAMLSELHDIHVSLRAGSQLYRYTGFDVRPAFFDPGVVANYMTDRGPAPNGHMAFGHMEPEIGHIWILHFARSGFDTDIDTALARLADVRALIVDVRDNPGGQLENVVTVASRFADRDRTYAFRSLRDGPSHDDLSPPEPLVVSPQGARRFRGPVVVLTNRRSMSAAEVFVLAMRALPNVTIVGDSTAGGSGSPATRELPNGWTYRFPASLLYDADLLPFEEIGLVPDIWVRGSSAELAAGRDAALDTALAVIRRALP